MLEQEAAIPCGFCKGAGQVTFTQIEKFQRDRAQGIPLFSPSEAFRACARLLYYSYKVEAVTRGTKLEGCSDVDELLCDELDQLWKKPTHEEREHLGKMSIGMSYLLLADLL